ncbi:MAG: hypothetical protein RLZZ480_648 [Candidatus Parcubacteria bacterium]|jgi:hypothetical protein
MLDGMSNENNSIDEIVEIIEDNIQQCLNDFESGLDELIDSID